MAKINITKEVNREIDINNTRRIILYYKGKKIGYDYNDGKEQNILLTAEGFELKNISKTFPQTYNIIGDSRRL